MEKSKPGLFSYIISGAIVIWLLSMCSGTASNSQKGAGLNQTEALTKCQYALKDQSKDPASAEVPYVENFGSGNEFYFAWGASSKPVRMKNSFGAMLSAGASCTVNKTTGQITSLSLDGKTVQ